MLWYFIFPIVGAIVGLLSGLLGLGGGIAVVPSLVFIFRDYLHLPIEVLVHLAVGTSLTTVIFTSLAAIAAHQRYGNINYTLFKQAFFPGLVGIILGGIIINHIHGQYLIYLIAGILLIVAYRQFTTPATAGVYQPVKAWVMWPASMIFSSLSMLLGLGGGVFFIPFFQRMGIDIREAAATNNLISLVRAFLGMLVYIYIGWQQTGLPDWSTGFIYWPAVLGISLFSMWTAPFGVRLAHRLSVKVLKRIFSLVLVVMVIKLLW